MLIAHGQVVHPGFVLVAKTEVQQIAGHRGGQLTALVAENTGEDAHFADAGVIQGSRLH